MSSFLSVSGSVNVPLFTYSFLCHPISRSLRVFCPSLGPVLSSLILFLLLPYLFLYSSNSVSFSHLFFPSLSRTSTLCHLLRSTPPPTAAPETPVPRVLLKHPPDTRCPCSPPPLAMVRLPPWKRSHPRIDTRAYTYHGSLHDYSHIDSKRRKTAEFKNWNSLTVFKPACLE